MASINYYQTAKPRVSLQSRLETIARTIACIGVFVGNFYTAENDGRLNWFHGCHARASARWSHKICLLVLLVSRATSAFDRPRNSGVNVKLNWRRPRVDLSSLRASSSRPPTSLTRSQDRNAAEPNHFLFLAAWNSASQIWRIYLCQRQQLDGRLCELNLRRVKVEQRHARLHAGWRFCGASAGR